MRKSVAEQPRSPPIFREMRVSAGVEKLFDRG
jgi:hypothetical protein